MIPCSNALNFAWDFSKIKRRKSIKNNSQLIGVFVREMTSTGGGLITAPTVSSSSTELTATAVFSTIFPPENIEKFDAMGPGELFQWNAISDLIDSFEGDDKLKILNVIAEKMDEIKNIGKDLEKVNFDNWRYESLTLKPEKMFKIQLDSTQFVEVAWDIDKLENSTATERMARQSQIISSFLTQETNLLDVDSSIVSEFDIKFGLNGNPDNVAQIVVKNIRFNGVDHTDVSLTEPITKIMFALSPELLILTESVSSISSADPRLKVKEQYDGITAYDNLGSASKKVLKADEPVDTITWRQLLEKSASNPRSIPRFQYQVEFKEWAKIVEKISEDIGISICIKESRSFNIIPVDDTSSAIKLLTHVVKKFWDHVNSIQSLTNAVIDPSPIEISSPWTFYNWVERNLLSIFTQLFPSTLSDANQSYYDRNETIQKGKNGILIHTSLIERAKCITNIKGKIGIECDSIKEDYENGDPLKSWDIDKPDKGKYIFPKIGTFYKIIQDGETKFQATTESRTMKGTNFTTEIFSTIAMILALSLKGSTRASKLSFIRIPTLFLSDPKIILPAGVKNSNIFVNLGTMNVKESWSNTNSWELHIEFNTVPKTVTVKGSLIPQFTYWLLFNGITIIPQDIKDMVMRFTKTDLDKEIYENLK